MKSQEKGRFIRNVGDKLKGLPTRFGSVIGAVALSGKLLAGSILGQPRIGNLLESTAVGAAGAAAGIALGALLESVRGLRSSSAANNPVTEDRAEL